MKYLVDSNILIYHLNGDKIATDFIIHNLFQSAISRITFIEVMSFNYSEIEEKEIMEFLNCFEIIDTSEEIAFQSIKNRKVKKIKIPDNIIASTAHVHNLTLITRNIADFNALDVSLLNIFEK